MSIDFTYSKSYRNMACLEKKYRPHPLSFKIVSNGVVLPYRKGGDFAYGMGGVLDEKGDFVIESAFSLPMNTSRRIDWGGAYPYSEGDCTCSSETVIFAGFLNNNEWGHFLVDWSVRLWYALEKDDTSRILFCTRGRDELHPNILRAISLAGIDTDRILLLKKGDRPARYARIILPEPSLTWEGYTDEYRLLFDRIRQSDAVRSSETEQHDRIYLTRTKLKHRKEFGEEILEKIFSENGFFIVSPENLSVEQQVFLMSHCREVACLEGTAAHNVLFSDPGIRQIILEKSGIRNMRQFFINDCCDNEVFYVGAYPDTCFRERDTEGPFLVGMTKEAEDFFDAYGFALESIPGEPEIRKEAERKYYKARLMKPWKQLAGKLKRRLWHG